VILVDTSVWIDHLRAADARLTRLLGGAQVLAHPWVTGELALGSLRDGEAVVGLLSALPQGTVATAEELLVFIRNASLSGTGIGYVDAHLLCSARLTADTRLWTLDKRLAGLAGQLGLAATTA
jgi:predicted nucleic acid-binding protein